MFKQIIKGASVIPLQFLGVMDVDMNQVQSNELMKYGLMNLLGEGKEGGYAVRHSQAAVSDFGRDLEGQERDMNPLAAAFPTLFPYGRGGFENSRRHFVSFNEQAHWSMQFYDQHFRTHHTFPFVVFSIEQKRKALSSARVQMHRPDFERNKLAIGSISCADMRVAVQEEAEGKTPSDPRIRLLRKHVFGASSQVMGSDNSRVLYRGCIWGTTLLLRGPSLWVTINPNDIHDPVAQVFAGEEINMDDFIATIGPDMHRRASNIAKDPFAATKYFYFILGVVFSALFAVDVDRNVVNARMGVIGQVSAYFGVVEAQGRGTLHLHCFIWLQDTPNLFQLRDLLKSPEFLHKIRHYLRKNVRAHVDGLDEETIRTTPRESQIGYSRPPDPDGPEWEEENEELERRVVRSSQIHSCSMSTCLRYDRYGRLSCKRRAPWPLSDQETVDEAGNWSPKRTYGFMNNFCPAITKTLLCNNDIKFITNGKDTKDVMWYTTSYATKKQSKNNNVSALMAKALLYHESHSDHLTSLLERNRLLIFRCQQAINREMELSGPQVMSYIMGYGDCIQSHHYTPLYWIAVQKLVERSFPEVKGYNNKLVSRL